MKTNGNLKFKVEIVRDLGSEVCLDSPWEKRR